MTSCRPLTHLRTCLAALVETMDPVVAEMVAGCEFEGRSVCDWTCRMIHQYIEVRSAWHDAGGKDADLPSLRLTADARLLTPLNQITEE